MSFSLSHYFKPHILSFLMISLFFVNTHICQATIHSDISTDEKNSEMQKVSWIDYFLQPYFVRKRNALIVPTPQKNMLWSHFLGYNPRDHEMKISALVDKHHLLIAKQSEKLFALNTHTGKTKWTAKARHKIASDAAVVDQVLLFTTMEPRLIALNINTGKVVWSTLLPSISFIKPLIDQIQHQVIIHTTTQQITAFNINNGKRLWSYKHPQESFVVMLHPNHMPHLIQETIIIGFQNGKVVGLDRKSGQKKWEKTVDLFNEKEKTDGTLFSKLNDIIFIQSSQKDSVYLASLQGLQSFSALTQQLYWDKKMQCQQIQLGKFLYVLDPKNKLYALDKENGEIVWESDQFIHPTTVSITQFKVSPDGTQLILGDSLGTIYYVSGIDGQLQDGECHYIASPFMGLAISDDKKFYTITRRGQIAAWRLIH